MRETQTCRHFAVTLVPYTTHTNHSATSLHNPHRPQRHRLGTPAEPQSHSQQEIRTKLVSRSAPSRRELLISLIKSCTHLTHLLPIHAHIVRTSFVQDPTVSLLFLSRAALSPVRDMGYARQFFSQISDPSVMEYNTMIRAYSMSDSPEEGVYMFRDIRRRGLSGDPVSSSFALKSCIRLLSLGGGTQVHARILRDGHQSNSLLLTTLMDLYSRCDRFHEVRKLFDEIPHRDTVAWNVLISCFLRNKRTREALRLFDVMQTETYGCEPNDVTCLLMLQACANLNALEFGERVHGYIEEHGYGGALNLSSSLISMYSRCGCPDKAYGVFKGMKDKNVVSWSAMISGLAINGHGRQALDAFREMQRMGVQPHAQTFIGVLSACSHCGLVDEGMTIFDCMSKEFGVAPSIHHYGCMVDLLGRAGKLDRAYQFIMSMNRKPDSTLWRTLLRTCKIHGHVNLGERVIEHLIELRAQEAGDYLLLLNIYSTAGYWEKVKELKKFMQEGGIQTTPPYSTIELEGVVHKFVADDVSHRRKDEIYKMLDEINSLLKIAGYTVDISSELHNLGAEEKGHALSYHSEKLAIAFGVLATPPGTTIRVSKNLRTCADCHNFAKVVSWAYNREVVIRDRNRIHHFQGGHCSCNDYW